jgi:hypothetical protein
MPVGAGLLESFFCLMHKEAGEEFQRNLWGSFSSDGSRSVWTVFLTASEVEDNHEIAKKLRRMKQTLDRMFAGTEWVPAGKSEFMANVHDEQVRFEEAMVFGAGEPPREILNVPKAGGVFFVTDGYGPAPALDQVVTLLGEELNLRIQGPELPEPAEPTPETTA